MFTSADGKDVNIKFIKELLRKFQFTMHIVFNSGRKNF